MLQRIKEKILKEPENFQMNYFTQFNTPCGTTACIAGWAVLLDAKDQGFEITKDWYQSLKSNVEQLASGLLGLDYSEETEEGKINSDTVFYVTDWPDDFKWRYKSATSQEKRAHIAAKYIDYLCSL